MSGRNALGWRLGSMSGVVVAGAGILAAATLIPRGPGPVPSAPGVVMTTTAARPSAPPPPVEPLELAPITAADAVTVNAAIPFVTGPNPAARAFRLGASGEARGRAVDCLAAAMLYEAGTEGDDGQRAVGQVVLNRVRHPAFPKTVCGVVFQGSERRTGCQFTFTCDGAMRRTPSTAAWERARSLSRAMLDGRVYKPVGLATHYHTNWVVPYWSETLDKIAGVGTHLFFRWRGWWGTPPAFQRGSAAAEPAVAALASLSDSHRSATPTEDTPMLALLDGLSIASTAARPQLAVDAAASARPVAAVEPPRLLADAGRPALLAPGEDSFIFLLDAAAPDGFPAVARRVCGGKSFCKFQGWTDRAQVPAGYPVPAERLPSMAFSYLRDRETGFDKMLWNCRAFPRADRSQCMRT